MTAKYLIVSEHSVNTDVNVDVVGKCHLYKFCQNRYLAIWIVGYDDIAVREIVRWIRCSDMWCIPVIIGRSNKPKNLTVDGYADNWGDFIRVVSPMLGHVCEDVDEQFRPLCYLASRNCDVIKPGHVSGCCNSDRCIKYPILDSFGIYTQHSWFETMLKDGYLKLNSKHTKCIYTCPVCYNDAFNFVEKCGTCGSNRLQHATLIHCFVCGHISNESMVGVGEIHCPSCKEKWKHRGVDYEYILGAVECLDCGTKAQCSNTFIECLNCESDLKEGELLKHWYGVYEFTRKVYDICKGGCIPCGNHPHHYRDPDNKSQTFEHFENSKGVHKTNGNEYIHCIISVDDMYNSMVERKLVELLDGKGSWYSDKNEVHAVFVGNRADIQKATESLSKLKAELLTVANGATVQIVDTHIIL